MSQNDPWAQYATPVDNKAPADPWAQYATPVEASQPKQKQWSDMTPQERAQIVAIRGSAAAQNFNNAALRPDQIQLGQGPAQGVNTPVWKQFYDRLMNTAPGAQTGMDGAAGALLGAAAPGMGSAEGLAGLAAGLKDAPLLQLPKAILGALTKPDQLMLRAAATKAAAGGEISATDLLSSTGLKKALAKITFGPTRARIEEGLAKFLSTGDTEIPHDVPAPIPFRRKPSIDPGYTLANVGPTPNATFKPPITTPSQPIDPGQTLANLGPTPNATFKPPITTPSQPIDPGQTLANVQMTPGNPVIVLTQKLSPGKLPSKDLVQASNRLLQSQPGLAKLTPQALKESLLNGYKSAGEAIKSAQAAVPADTTVDMVKAKLGWVQQAQQAQESGMTASASKLMNMVKSTPDRLPWNQFLSVKDSLKSAAFGGRSRNFALSQAYGELIDASRGISPELDTANAQSSMYRSILDAAKIHPETGITYR